MNRPASAFDIRETLDETVRRLAVNAAPIQQRVRAAGLVILERLSPADFAGKEDRELFEQIQAALRDMPRSGASADPPRRVAGQMSDGRAEEIASDILDLRDITMGRAIREARMTTVSGPRGRSRR